MLYAREDVEAFIAEARGVPRLTWRGTSEGPRRANRGPEDRCGGDDLSIPQTRTAAAC